MDKASDTMKVADDVADTAKAVDNAGDTVNAADGLFDVTKIIEELPTDPVDLTQKGWKDITLPATRKNSTSRTYTNGKVTVRYDKSNLGARGYRGKDHYHILNPNSTGKHDYYLDKLGRPIPKNSKASHIIKEKE